MQFGLTREEAQGPVPISYELPDVKGVWSMVVPLAEAKVLCTKEELAVVKASRHPELSKLTAAQVKRHATLARKLMDKWSDQSRSQARTSNRATGSSNLDSRSHAKTALFRETLDALELRLSELETATLSKTPVPKGTPKQVRAKQSRVARSQERRNLHVAKKGMNAVAKPAPSRVVDAPVEVVKPVAKKTPRRKVATKTATAVKAAVASRAKKPAKKAVAKAARPTKRAIASAAAAPVAGSAPVNRAASRKAAGTAASRTKAKAVPAADRLKANRIAASNKSSNILGHVSGKGKRAQAKRDRKG
ncbi:MAG: hypothetical protein ACKN81_02680 [Pirellulaceae bacterium]